jgi:antitoxin PrlF
MAAATVTSKGQITIPVSVRKKLDLSFGSRVEFVELSDGRVEMVAAVNDVTLLKGMVSVNKHPSIDKISHTVNSRPAT